MHVTNMALISILVELTIVSGQPSKLPHMLRGLETGKNTKVEITQDQALEILRCNPTMSLMLLNSALDILLFHKNKTDARFQELMTRIKQINNAISFLTRFLFSAAAYNILYANLPTITYNKSLV